MNRYVRAFPFIGRLVIGGIFLMSAVAKLLSYGATVRTIEAAGLPFASLGWICSILLESSCGLSLLVGFRVRTPALALAVFCVATAALFHGHISDATQRIEFLTNWLIAGGLLQIAYFGAGPNPFVSESNREYSQIRA
jgi:putative oxidoreductase